MKILLTLPGLILLTTIVGHVAAQSGAGYDQRGMPFTQLDMDGDGLVSEQEFYRARADYMASRAASGRPMRNAANAPDFAQLDINRDGMLSHEELATARQLRQKAMRGMYGPGGGKVGGRGRNRPTYTDFDLNHDGIVEEAEFIDARNQRISERASQGYAMRGLSNMRPFSELDTDGDGKLSQQEFAAAQSRHSH